MWTRAVNSAPCNCIVLKQLNILNVLMLSWLLHMRAAPFVLCHKFVPWLSFLLVHQLLTSTHAVIRKCLVWQAGWPGLWISMTSPVSSIPLPQLLCGLSTELMRCSCIFNQTWRGTHSERCGSFFIMQILICCYTSNTLKWTKQLSCGPHHKFIKSDARSCLQQNIMDSWRTLHVALVVTVSCHVNRASWQNNMFYSPTTEIY
jgi:hypothetical protein